MSARSDANNKYYIAWAGCCVLPNLIGREVAAVRSKTSGKESHRPNRCNVDVLFGGAENAGAMTDGEPSV